jgi:hypothetical protein
MDDITQVLAVSEEGPSLEVAKEAARTLVHEVQPDAADLPGDVRDGDGE